MNPDQVDLRFSRFYSSKLHGRIDLAPKKFQHMGDLQVHPGPEARPWRAHGSLTAAKYPHLGSEENLSPLITTQAMSLPPKSSQLFPVHNPSKEPSSVTAPVTFHAKFQHQNLSGNPLAKRSVNRLVFSTMVKYRAGVQEGTVQVVPQRNQHIGKADKSCHLTSNDPQTATERLAGHDATGVLAGLVPRLRFDQRRKVFLREHVSLCRDLAIPNVYFLGHHVERCC